MSFHCLYSAYPRRVLCSLGLNLCLPVALGLCILTGPNLGLPNSAQAGDCRQYTDEACEEANLGRDIPSQPRPELDAIHIRFAWAQYRLLVNAQRASQACLRSVHSVKERRCLQNTVADFQDDYRCVYQEITPQGRRRAHLPVPEESVFHSPPF